MAEEKSSIDSGQAYPWMRPLWVRIAIVLVCAAWTGVETYFGERLWSMVAAGATGYAVWTFFITWKDGGKPADGQATDEDNA